MQPFTDLITTVKGKRRNTKLAPCTAFIGPNEAGKTALIDTIRVALTGKHPIGRTNKSLIRLTTSQPLECDISGPDASARFEIPVTRGGKPKKATHDLQGALAGYDADDIERIMPTVSLRELTTIGSAKAREAIFRRFGNIPHVLQPPGLSTEQQNIWREALQNAVGADAVDTLSKMGTVFRSMNLSIGKEIKTVEKHITDQRASVSMLTAGSEQIPQLEEQYKKAVAASSTAGVEVELAEQQRVLSVLEVRAQDILREEQEITVWKTEQEQLLGELAESRAAQEDALNDFIGRVAADQRRLERSKVLAEIADAMVSGQVQSCVMCAHTVDPKHVQTRARDRAQYREQAFSASSVAITDMRSGLQSIDNEIAQIRSALETRALNYRTRREQLRGQIAQTKAAIEALEATKKGAATYDGPTAEEIKGQIDTLRQADNMRHRLAEDAERLSGFKARKEAIRVCAEEATELLQAVLQNIAQTAEQTVNKYMPGHFTAKLSVSDGDCEWLVAGVDGVARCKHTRTGAQKAALALGLMLGWSDNMPVRLVTLDDEDLSGLSEINVRTMLEDLSQMQSRGEITQVFVATSRDGDIPGGYTSVDVTTL